MEINKIQPLVEKAIEGDKKAYADLCEEIVRDVLYVCIKITGNVHQGEDAAQEALIRMGTYIKKLRDPQAFPLWLNRHLANSCLNYLRKEKRHQNQEGDGLLESVMEENIEFLPQQWAEQDDTRQMVLSALEKLPSKQKHLLLMYYFQNLNTREIAQIHNITESTVRSKLQYARANLKKQIENMAGAQLSTMPAVAAVPVITLILQRDAAGLITEESAKKVLLAVGAVLAGGVTTVGGVQIATLVASIAPAAVAVVVAASVAFSGNISAASTNVSSPSPSHPPEDVIGVPPQYSDSVSVQKEGEGGLYIPPSSTQQSEVDAWENNPIPESEQPQQPGEPVKHEARGRLVLVDAQNQSVAQESINLSGILIEAQVEGHRQDATYTKADGSYTLSLPNAALEYTIAVSSSGIYGLNFSETQWIYKPGDPMPEVSVWDVGAPVCHILFIDEAGKEQDSMNPAYVEVSVRDISPCSVEWSIYRYGSVQPLTEGEGNEVQLDFLPRAYRGYTIVFTVTDLAGNQTVVERDIYIR